MILFTSTGRKITRPVCLLYSLETESPKTNAVVKDNALIEGNLDSVNFCDLTDTKDNLTDTKENHKDSLKKVPLNNQHPLTETEQSNKALNQINPTTKIHNYNLRPRKTILTLLVMALISFGQVFNTSAKQLVIDLLSRNPQYQNCSTIPKLFNYLYAIWVGSQHQRQHKQDRNLLRRYRMHIERTKLSWFNQYKY